MATLRLFRNGRLVQTVGLGATVVSVGRDADCALVLDSPSASRIHFQVIPRPEGGYLLEDLGSSNGTFVDGVREYRKPLLARATIQVGEELILFEPTGAATADATPMPRRASKFAEMRDRDHTAHVPPAVQRRALARDMARTRPHVVLEQRSGPQIFALDTAVTTVGFGPVRISLGPSPSGAEQVLAEIVRVRDDAFFIRAKGLFARISVNGNRTAKSSLASGDRFTVGDFTFRFELGLDG